MDLTRRVDKEETLRVEPCPVCYGDISVRDCGYSSFNPGKAECGVCGRIWELGNVDDTWGAGIKWNEKARSINHRLKLLSLLTVNIPLSPSRDYYLEDKAEEAEELKKELAKMIIGAK
jgi:hypothetical protein